MHMYMYICSSKNLPVYLIIKPLIYGTAQKSRIRCVFYKSGQYVHAVVVLNNRDHRKTMATIKLICIKL